MGSEILDRSSQGLGEMFEGDSPDTCAGKFPLKAMGGRADGLVCADPGARNPIGVSGVLVLPLASGRNEGGHYFRYFSTLTLLGTAIQNPRRGCHRNSNFCMGS